MRQRCDLQVLVATCFGAGGCGRWWARRTRPWLPGRRWSLLLAAL